MKVKNGSGVNFIFKPESYYSVKVKIANDFSDTINAIFYSGWISPNGARACVWSGSFEEPYYGDIHSMDVICEVNHLK